MQNNFQYFFESFAKFHYSLFIKGWCKAEDDVKIGLKNINCRSRFYLSHTWRCVNDNVNIDKNGVEFVIHILLKEAIFPDDIYIDFHFSDDKHDTLDVAAIQKSILLFKTSALDNSFREIIGKQEYKRILDIGGRARSGLDRSKEFPNKEVVVLDIIEGNNVDVVGDAHTMSEKFEPNSFDAVYCVSVFEHLIMPWKVALEINRILRMGGIALIHTHQTIGMHDLPWDFYRYSDTAWKGIFNKHSGFEIIQTELKELQYILPFFYREKYHEAEKSAGYEGSTVLVKKIGDTVLEWPLGAADVTMDMYPDVPDNNRPEDILNW